MVAVLEQTETPLRRVWAMPSKNTFDVPPIRALVRKYLYASKVSIDPFARNKRWATYTNDLNPDTAAEYHMDARAFLEMLVARGVQADLVIFDPPYSVEQCKTSYSGFGADFDADAVQEAWGRWSACRKAIGALLRPNGVALSFGWDSMGIGQQHGMELVELLLVCHGAGHNDTICTVERKIESMQTGLFAA